MQVPPPSDFVPVGDRRGPKILSPPHQKFREKTLKSTIPLYWPPRCIIKVYYTCIYGLSGWYQLIYTFVLRSICHIGSTWVFFLFLFLFFFFTKQLSQFSVYEIKNETFRRYHFWKTSETEYSWDFADTLSAKFCWRNFSTNTLHMCNIYLSLFV